MRFFLVTALLLSCGGSDEDLESMRFVNIAQSDQEEQLSTVGYMIVDSMGKVWKQGDTVIQPQWTYDEATIYQTYDKARKQIKKLARAEAREDEEIGTVMTPEKRKQYIREALDDFEIVRLTEAE